MALYLLPGHISVNYSMFFTPQVATVTRLNVEFIPDTTRFAQPAFFFTSICLKSLELIQIFLIFSLVAMSVRFPSRVCVGTWVYLQLKLIAFITCNVIKHFIEGIKSPHPPFMSFLPFFLFVWMFGFLFCFVVLFCFYPWCILTNKKTESG